MDACQERVGRATSFRAKFLEERLSDEGHTNRLSDEIINRTILFSCFVAQGEKGCSANM